jgi:O-antigen/teichoic acid export membrane protein
VLPLTPSYGTLVRNVAAIAAGRLVAIVLALVLSTLLVRVLGLAAYGTWSLFFLFIGYGALFDFGLSVAVEAAVARAVQRDDAASIDRLLNTALLLATAMSAILQGVVALTPVSWLARAGETTTVARCLAVLPFCLLCSNVAAVGGAALSGLQRADRLSALRIAFGSLATGAVVALAAGGVRDLATLLVAYAVCLGATGIAAWRAVASWDSTLRLRPWHADRTALRELTRIGGLIQVTTSVSQVGDYALRLLLGARFGVSAIGAYDLATRAAMVPRSLSASLLATLVPFAAGREAAHGRADLADVVARSMRFITLFLVAASVPLVVCADLLVAVWLGPIPEAGIIAAMLRVVTVSLLVQSVFGPIASAARGVQRPGAEAVATVLTQPVVVILAAVQPTVIAAIGILAAGLAVSAGLLCLWLIRGLRLRSLPGVRAGRLALLAAGVTGTVLATRVVLDAAGAPALLTMAAGGAASLLATAALMLVLRVVANDERRLVLARVRESYSAGVPLA